MLINNNRTKKKMLKLKYWMMIHECLQLKQQQHPQKKIFMNWNATHFAFHSLIHRATIFFPSFLHIYMCLYLLLSFSVPHVIFMFTDTIMINLYRDVSLCGVWTFERFIIYVNIFSQTKIYFRLTSRKQRKKKGERDTQLYVCLWLENKK